MLQDRALTAHVRFVLVAGEASGDQLGAALITALRKHFPHAEFAGVGGPLMLSLGLDLWFEAEELSVMGLVEVIRHLPRLLARRREVIRCTLSDPPNVYIGIDAPDFNLPIERRLKGEGITTTHYVSPSIWAWRRARAAKIGRSADLVLCLFPFEPALYAQHGVNARFVGHPLADLFPLEPAPTFARATLGLPLSGKVLALLPGSRAGEVERLAPIFLETARRLKQAIPKLTIALPLASPRVRAQLERMRLHEHSLLMFEGHAQLVLQAADVVLVASGTAALEAALARKPMAVAYRVHPITYWLARTLGMLKAKFFSLPNALAGYGLVQEFEQAAVRADLLFDALLPMLQEPIPDALATAYHDMHMSLRRDASAEAAQAIVELMDGR